MKSLVALAIATTTVATLAGNALADPRFDINPDALRALRYSTEQTLNVTCSSTGQSCDRSANFTFDVGDPTFVNQITLKAPASHCSQVSYTLRDSTGNIIGAPSRFLNSGESATLFVGDLSTGRHTFYISATGMVGGCNAGRVYSWGVDTSAIYIPQ